MNRLRLFIGIALIAAIACLFWFTTKHSQAQPKVDPEITLLSKFEKVSASKTAIETTKGTIEFELYPNDAPRTVTNFVTLAKNGYYNNLVFFRVEPDFVVQGGDPKGDGSGRYSIYGPTFEDELNPNTESYKSGYKEGVIAMANHGPNTNTSQFFIMLTDQPDLAHDYTIFGKVTAGMDVVHKLLVGDKILSISIP